MISSKRAFVVVCALGICLGGCGADAPPEPRADAIFHGDNIVTMDPNQPTIEAVAVRGQTIAAAGDLDEVMALRGESTRVVDLGNRALLPGFIDAHGHILAVGAALETLSLHSPPIGDVTNMDELVAKIQRWIAVNKIAPGETVSGGGYDDSLLEEGRHPTRYDLDRASTQHQIVLNHVSGHLTTVNSAALAANNISSTTQDPPGGHIRRVAGSMEPDGVLEEAAGMALLMGDGSGEAALPWPMDDLDGLIRRSIEVYSSYGTTTVQDGATFAPLVQVFRKAAAAKPLKADVVAYEAFGFFNLGETDTVAGTGYAKEYTDGFRIGGVKFVLDGSPQGRTAWVTQPYNEGPPGAAADYVAYPTMVPETYLASAADLIQRGVPFIAHGNGDAAMDLMMDGVEAGVAGMEPMPDHRSVIIHAQLMRADQLDRAAQLGVVPSFFAAHAYFWGDWHRRSFGEERGNNVSPLRWAVDRGVHFTIHNDANVVPPDIMRLVSIAVNRKTRSGHVLGPHQRATVMEALNAVTLGAAYQYFEEDIKGSITVGKQADLVILEQNPLTSDPADLEFIKIMETISRGRSVFSQ